jgi:hypothetical protein
VTNVPLERVPVGGRLMGVVVAVTSLP